MDNNSQTTLPPGFIGVEDAIKLIESDTRSDAKVDTQWLVSHLKWIEVDHNFRIPKLRNATPAEIEDMRKNPRLRGRIKSTVSDGSVNVYIERAFHAEALKEAIKNHYKAMVGQDYQESIVRGTSTVADENETGGAVKIRSVDPITKEGTDISDGVNVTANEVA